MRIGIDVDDVAVDLLTPWLNRIARAVGMPPGTWSPLDLTQWEFFRDIGISELVVHEQLVPELYDEALPYEGFAEAVAEIRKLGHEVVYVTSSRDLEQFQAKVLWLARHDHGSLHSEIHPVGKWTEFKTKSDPRLHLDWLIDDYTGNLEGFPGYPVLMTRPHNYRTIWPGKRVKSLRDVVKMLEHVPVPTEPGFLDARVLADYNAAHCQVQRRDPMEELKLINCSTGKTGGACWTEPQGPVGGAVAGPATPIITDQEAAAIFAHNEKVRVFSTGATRDADTGKLDYEGFLSPLVLRSFAEFMHENRYQKDGSLRDSDNWQKGIPLDAYMKSMFRHFMEVWMIHRGLVALDEKGQPVDLVKALNALHFNVQGYQHEHLKAQRAKSLQDNAA